MAGYDQMMAALTVRRGPDAGRRFSIEAPTVTIGRHPQCDFQMNDVWLSRQHARITWTGMGYTIEDLGSTNGTYVNGERVVGPHALKSGDLLQLGEQVELAFHVSVPAPLDEMPMLSGIAPSPGSRASPPQAEPPPTKPIPVQKRSFLRGKAAVWALSLLCVFLCLIVGGGAYSLLSDKGQRVADTPTALAVLPQPTAAPALTALTATPTPTVPATATPTPVVSAGEWIVFSSTQGDNDEDNTSETNIFIMRPDGSERSQLTSHSGSDWSPDLSPDGQTVLFVSDRDGEGHIHSTSIDGTGLKRLTPSGGTYGDPSWSPDGQKIVFVSGQDNEGDEIYTMNADGSEITRLTDHESGCRDPEFSPDGQLIAYSCFSTEGGYDIYVMNADGSNAHRITEGINFEVEPSWSPDGTRIAYSCWYMDKVEKSRSFNVFTLTNSRMMMLVSFGDDSGLERLNSGIHTIDLAGIDSRALVVTEGSSNWSPAWSPDGQILLFVSDRDGAADIYAITLDSLDVKNITDNEEDDYTPNW